MKSLLALVAVLVISGCPKNPAPTPTYPPDADAAPPALTVSCDVACKHVATVPGAASYDTCMGVCQPIQNRMFAICLNSASTVTDINNCDR